MTLIELHNITKSYEVTPPISVLRGIDLSVQPGEKISIIGRSGAGKSTLLNILGLLDAPSDGDYLLNGVHAENLTDRERDTYRALSLGFIFQDFHVLGHRSVYDNLDLKLAIAAVPPSKRQEKIKATLEDVGLSDRCYSLARLLSGGEKQRLAIARAIISSPQLLLADEPTGNLDPLNARAVLDLFDLQAKKGVAVIVITHDERLSAWADRVLILDEGKLHECSHLTSRSIP